jgi:hypothetical protein
MARRQHELISAQAGPLPGAQTTADLLRDPDFGPRLVLETIPELSSGVWRLHTCRVTSARKKMRKRILFLEMSYDDGCGMVHDEVVAKLYGSDRGANAFRALTFLWESGFRSPAGHRVPRPYGYSRKLATLVQGHVPGGHWADVLLSPNGVIEDASERAAEWLVHLHGTDIPAARRGPKEEDIAVTRYARELVRAFPAAARDIEALTARIHERLPEVGEPSVTVHGDFHAKNVFLQGSVTAVIDFDTFARGEPAIDLGFAVGQLLIMSYFRSGSFQRGGRAARAFLTRYDDWSPERLALHVARTLLQSLHYELCVLRNGRVELLALWPDLMRCWLDADGPSAVEDLLRGR